MIPFSFLKNAMGLHIYNFFLLLLQALNYNEFYHIRFKEEIERVRDSLEFRKKIENHLPLIKKLSQGMGRKSLINLRELNTLYQTLAAEKAMNLALPQCAESDFRSGLLKDGAALWYSLFCYNDNLKKLSGGEFHRKHVIN